MTNPTYQRTTGQRNRMNKRGYREVEVAPSLVITKSGIRYARSQRGELIRITGVDLSKVKG